ncbi:ABC-three component system middle component 6 [Cytobacillus praedii]|uniref:ABC-three component system middle component 6 n=1 Tax=Cytobacillus praedii TaxID=1742358 RepID=UPI00070DF3B0|nr:ABC-three component system middle component 6 [Cytobacillus praedii]
MILPNKYVSNSESLIGLSALILSVIGKKTIHLDKLWKMFEKKYINEKLNNPPTYQKFILTLNLMFMVGMIEYTEEGEIYNENIKSNSE